MPAHRVAPGRSDLREPAIAAPACRGSGHRTSALRGGPDRWALRSGFPSESGRATRPATRRVPRARPGGGRGGGGGGGGGAVVPEGGVVDGVAGLRVGGALDALVAAADAPRQRL